MNKERFSFNVGIIIVKKPCLPIGTSAFNPKDVRSDPDLWIFSYRKIYVRILVYS